MSRSCCSLQHSGKAFILFRGSFSVRLLQTEAISSSTQLLGAGRKQCFSKRWVFLMGNGHLHHFLPQPLFAHVEIGLSSSDPSISSEQVSWQRVQLQFPMWQQAEGMCLVLWCCAGQLLVPTALLGRAELRSRERQRDLGESLLYAMGTRSFLTLTNEILQPALEMETRH